jgi:hypothetical protein
MSKDKNYKSKKGNDYVIKGGVYTGYGAFDKDGNKVLDGYDHPVDVMIAINKTEDKTEQNQSHE